MQYNTILYYAIRLYAEQHYAILCYAIHDNNIQHSTRVLARPGHQRRGNNDNTTTNNNNHNNDNNDNNNNNTNAYH